MTTTVQVTRRKPDPSKQSFSSWQDRQKLDRTQRPRAEHKFEEARSYRGTMAHPHAASAPVSDEPKRQLRPAIQEPVVFKDIELNKRYTSKRVGKTVHVYPVEVKKNKVVLKRDLEAKDSFTESRANFDKYFVLDEV